MRGTLKMTIFWDSPIASISTPNFGPISMKLGPVVRFTKKITLYKCGPLSSPNYGETAICPLGQKVKNGPKIRFLLKRQPQKFIWEKYTFYFEQLCQVVARTF